jgi:sulfofructosephosphate aldolase
MVALDQRESLRTMFAERLGHPVGDDVLVRFKLAAAAELAADASGLLIDRQYGYRRLVAEHRLPTGCGLILAADALDQAPGGPVADTDIDPEVAAVAAAGDGAVALKLLLVWRRDERRATRVRLAERFVAMCRAAGLASVLEPVVRPAPGEAGFDLDTAILEAAVELGPLRPSLYKAQVPGLGQSDDASTEAVCRKLTACLPVPWVVLSQGVPMAAFPRAVRIACRAGASGFLAGRAVWSDCLTAGDPHPALRELAVPRLRELAGIVDHDARPWHAVGGRA